MALVIDSQITTKYDTPIGFIASKFVNTTTKIKTALETLDCLAGLQLSGAKANCCQYLLTKLRQNKTKVYARLCMWVADVPKAGVSMTFRYHIV